MELKGRIHFQSVRPAIHFIIFNSIKLDAEKKGLKLKLTHLVLTKEQFVIPESQQQIIEEDDCY
jgi:hypothetical protein